MSAQAKKINTPAQVLFASLVGTTVEFFDFYIYAIAAALVFPKLFFPSTSPSAAVLLSYATFGVAFVARPVGSALFGHFGDRIGRKRTLVVALSTMGLSTFIIGILPSYHTIGILAPLLLALCRFGQGIGLGGEWGGAVLLAVENAPPNRRALYGSFPQLGAPIGFVFSGGIFLLLSKYLTNDQFFEYGWRAPFLMSAVLVLLGLYVRLTITETPVFANAVKHSEPVKLPIGRVFTHYTRPLIAGTLACISTFVLFYLMTVFALGWGTSALHYSRQSFLYMQLGSMFFFALTIPLSALLAERGRRPVMIGITILIGIYGLVFGSLFQSGAAGAFITLALGLALMGATYGPLGTIVSEVFPTAVRYTGSSLAFSLGGVLGASATPNIATWLAKSHGLSWVGYYLTLSAVVTLVGILFTRETSKDDLTLPAEPV
ncbi:MFS transporter [Granulicella cerasi]|uniref:MFS transporter n=1 Tax=Granulicella cerasi TaxID=741063 RepID=A0ABW1Z3U8_9BACT|nr:MFS transporter [Granulicella cerasi]